MKPTRFGLWGLLPATMLGLLIAGCKPSAETGSAIGPGNVDLGPPATDAPPADGTLSPEGGPRLGSTSLEVVDAAGYQSVLDNHRGKVVLVDFWATWCVPCRQGFPHTVELSRAYADDGLAVISVSLDDPDESKDAALEFLQEQHADFTNLISSLGSGTESVEAFDIDGGGVPHYKLYDREGALIRKFSSDGQSAIDPATVEAAVREALGLPAE